MQQALAHSTYLTLNGFKNLATMVSRQGLLSIYSATLQAKPAWDKGKAKQLPQCNSSLFSGKKGQIPFSSPVHQLLTATDQ